MSGSCEGRLAGVKHPCKFAGKCSCFSSESYVCTHGGSDYCGRFRALNGDEKHGQ